MIMKLLKTHSLVIFALSAALAACSNVGAQNEDAYCETISWDEDARLLAIAAEDSGVAPADDSLMTEDENENTTPQSAADSAADGVDTSSHVAEEPVATSGQESAPASPSRRLKVRNIGRLHEVFNDSNHYQLEHARRLGIEPISHLGQFYNTRRPLVKIATNKDFAVDELKHSFPYLVPEAAKLLHDIGRNFQDSLKAGNGGNYRIIVTSVLRTPGTVKRLRRVNGNATQESTHQYATTFDITYTRFEAVDGKEVNSQGDLKNILAEVLHDLHQQGRCMVKYERKSPCFHITVVK